MTEPVILFIATAGPNDISIARREPDGTLRRAEYANVNWLDRLSGQVDHVVTLNPHDDVYYLRNRLKTELAREWQPRHILDLENHLSGYFTAMKKYHGSDQPDEIAGVGHDVRLISEAIGVPVQSYDPDKNSTNRLNWTMRLWERTRN